MCRISTIRFMLKGHVLESLDRRLRILGEPGSYPPDKCRAANGRSGAIYRTGSLSFTRLDCRNTRAAVQREAGK